jgi:hypothetical protein
VRSCRAIVVVAKFRISRADRAMSASVDVDARNDEKCDASHVRCSDG